MAGDFDALRHKIDRLSAQFDGRQLEEMTHRVAGAAKKDALAAAVTDLGPDRKFTNWRPKLGAGYDITSPGVAEVKARPSGPWKVATSGRKAGTKYSKRAGRQVGWGATQGKGTWISAAETMKRETPARVHKEVQRALREVF